jgi:thioredoxin reductase (NADPH)
VVRTRTIVIATGVKYRKLDLPSLARFEGAGVFYSATSPREAACEGEEIAIVGGGNSAGQAAVFCRRRRARPHAGARAGLARACRAT